MVQGPLEISGASGPPVRPAAAAGRRSRAADELFIPFTIGGGIRSVEDAQAVLDAGADAPAKLGQAPITFTQWEPMERTY